ncbi:hypothetical protein V1511DRAFT_535838 [Dipodascopsis uninucleata]
MSSRPVNQQGDYDTLIDVDAEGIQISFYSMDAIGLTMQIHYIRKTVDLGESDLEFHDFHTGDIQGKMPPSGQGAPFNPEVLDDDPNRVYSIWTVRFYQQFFNVDTTDVAQRCVYALYPRVSFVETVGDNPDLYGPFWIASTVILVLFFSSTVAGAIASHLSGVRYEYNFGLLSAATGLMYGYTFIVPIALWAALKYYKSDHARLLECMTLYGYANTIWVPVALVSISPIEIFNLPTVSNVVRWISAGIGYAVSTTFLIRNLFPVLNSIEAKTSKILLILVVLANFGLALAVKVLFFAYSIENNTATNN